MFTGNYGEAGAFEWYGVDTSVFSGHNGWRNWDRPSDDGRPVVVVGLDPREDFLGCEQVAALSSAVDVDNEEDGRPVWVCAGPALGWDATFARLAHYSA